MGLKQDLGLTRGQADETFGKIWEEHGFSKVGKNDVVRTAPIQSLYKGDKERSKEQIQKYKGSVKQKLGAQVTAAKNGGDYEKALEQVSKNASGSPTEKVMDAGEVEGPTPLVFDPEILSILKETSPLLEWVPQEGQEGYKAVYNRIDQRDPPIGHVSESTSLNLLSQSNDFNLDKNEVDMDIYVDVAEISDFTQAAAEHYMNVQETTLAQRVQEHAVDKARKMLYGTPRLSGYTSNDAEDGGLYDEETYRGMIEYFEEAGNQVDKSGFSGTVVEDVKTEIATLQDDVPVRKQNLVIYTSNALQDYMENEVDERARHDSNDTEVNFGLSSIRVDGVPVVGGHQVQAQTYETEIQAVDTTNETIDVEGDLTQNGPDGDALVETGTDEVTITDSTGNDGTYTISSLSYSSGSNVTTVTVSGDLTDGTADGNAQFSDIRGDNGDIFIFSTRSVRFRALAPLSTMPLAREGLSENVALFEFGALIAKAEGAFGKHLEAYPQV